uniref:Uncharacterized protein n=1 Tax=Oryza nivara TaxID=4536 RepID=A0A0E0GXS1_ORYNI
MGRTYLAEATSLGRAKINVIFMKTVMGCRARSQPLRCCSRTLVTVCWTRTVTLTQPLRWRAAMSRGSQEGDLDDDPGMER